jgi:transcriptional regulator with XRE-family HTH domain
VRNALKGTPDYAYGQTMLMLRTAIGLTQKGLANHLGITRRAVGEWETGSSYPKTEHLKELILLAVQKRVFAAENAAEEIRALWQVTHQKVSLDERWLAAVLDQHCPPYPQALPARIELSTEMQLQVQINFVISLGHDEAVVMRKRPLSPSEVIVVLNRSYHTIQESGSRETRESAQTAFNVCYEWLRSRKIRFHQTDQGEWVLNEADNTVDTSLKG